MQIVGFHSLRQTQLSALPRVNAETCESPRAGHDQVSLGATPDANLPDISGMTAHPRGALAVTDAKLESNRPRLGLVEGTSGKFQALPEDWSQTGRARDLEAITSLKGQPGQYLAVEGSGWNGSTNRLFELTIDEHGARAERSHSLPALPQEIEGLVETPLKDGRHLVVLGGRGGENGEPARLYWGVLDRNSGQLDFTPQGLEGVEVKAPRLSAPGQRDVSELELRPDGSLWASCAVDNGDQGPFQARVYQVGRLRPDSDNPIDILDSHRNASGTMTTKVEGFCSWGGGFLTGSDNEAMGGEIGFLIARP